VDDSVPVMPVRPLLPALRALLESVDRGDPTTVPCNVIVARGVVLGGTLSATVLRGRVLLASCDAAVSTARGSSSAVTLVLSRRTQPNGGTTWLLNCGVCGRRCRALYESPRNGWQCRQCLGLAYPTQRMMTAERLDRRAAQLRAAVGATPDDDAARTFPAIRPRGWWSSRFERMRALHDDVTSRALAVRLAPIARWLAHRRACVAFD
jgi:hypothetical protein